MWQGALDIAFDESADDVLPYFLQLYHHLEVSAVFMFILYLNPRPCTEGGGLMHPHPMSFSGMAAELLGGSR